MERAVAIEFQNAGWTVLSRDLPESDMLVFKGTQSEILEVKNEDNYRDGQNACVEMIQIDRLQGFKPSGLWATEATVCIHSFGEVWLAYRAKPMLNSFFLDWCGTQYFDRYSRPFGDNGNSGFLVKKSWLEKQHWADFVPKTKLPCSKLFRSR